MMSFIALDIGNTNVSVGVLKGTVVERSFKFETGFLKSPKKAKEVLRKGLAEFLGETRHVQAVYACSVVPALNANIKKIVKSFFKMDPVIVGEDVPVPIINRYRIPHQVGQDRLVNAYAGLKLYGGGLIIVDFGTAVTFDIVSKKAEYIGGLIVPGLRLMQESLHKKTALLPYVELAKPMEIIGKDTVSSIRAGIVFGVAGLCDGILTRLLKKECRGFKVIVTGGDAHLIKPYSAYFSCLEDHLIFKGLVLIFNSQIKRV